MCAELLLYGYCFTDCPVMLQGIISKHIRSFIYYYYYYDNLLVRLRDGATFNQKDAVISIVSAGIVIRTKTASILRMLRSATLIE